MDSEQSITLTLHVGENDQVFAALERIRDAWPFLDSLEDALAYALGWAIAHGITTAAAEEV